MYNYTARGVRNSNYSTKYTKSKKSSTLLFAITPAAAAIRRSTTANIIFYSFIKFDLDKRVFLVIKKS